MAGMTHIISLAAGFMQAAAQPADGELDMEFVVPDESIVLLFAGFIAAVLGLCMFLARDIIFRRKTVYDSAEYESKKDRTYEKYHSDWNDDYEDFGSRKSGPRHEEFAKAARNSELPDYYAVLGLARDATQNEIKQNYRRLAKKSHPDRTRDGAAKDAMAEINRAYEVLSDRDTRASYDRYLD